MSESNSKRFNPYRQFVGAFIPLWLLTNPDIHAGAKLVYARLAMFAGKNGHCYPSVTTIANATGIGIRTVQRHLKELEDARLIEREQIDGIGCQYFFLQHPCQNGTGDRMAPDPCQNGTQRDSTRDSTPSKKGTRMAEGWRPDEAVLKWAIDTATTNTVAENPSMWVRNELEKFIDYWMSVAGKGGVKLNWNATFRNWIRKGIEHRRNQNAKSRPYSHNNQPYDPASTLDTIIDGD